MWRTHSTTAARLLAAACMCMAAGGTALAFQQTGFLPLNDLGPGTFQGYEGGLYAGGSNQPPAAHLQAGLTQIQQIEPLDANGQPSSSGLIGMISIGMSNATQEFSRFQTIAEQDPERNQALRLVDCAQGGQHAAAIADPAASYWTSWVPGRLSFYGVDRNQVQVVWLKTSLRAPSLPFVNHANLLKGYLQTIAQILRAEFPALQAVFLSSRTFAGYANVPLNPEPFAYEDGFAVKWLIDEQIQGKPALNHDPSRGVVRAPFLAWGPYLWADGLLPRSDGLEYEPTDFESDGTHPSAIGEDKVAHLLLDFFKGNALTRPWFVQPGTPGCDQEATVEVYGSGAPGAFGVPRVATTARPGFDRTDLGLQAYLAHPGSLGAFLVGTQPLPEGQVVFGNGSVLVNPTAVVLVPTGPAGEVELRGFGRAGKPSFCGTTFYVQFAVNDPTTAGHLAFSRGIAVTLGR